MDTINMELNLPRWEYSYSIDNMKPELAALGMEIAFDDAAAITAISIGPTSVITPGIFKIDHPFLYTIVEKQTSTVLFTGVVNDPSGN
jgi:serine protease inhibitor